MDRLRRGLVIVAVVAVPFVGGAIALRIANGSPEYPVLAQACVYGALSALLAIGLVLIYRSSRVINFANATFGVVSSALFFELMSYENISFWLALPAAIVSGAVLGALTELILIRRFFRAPRLVVAVVTIGIAQLLAGLAGQMAGIFGDQNSPIDPQRKPNYLPRGALIRTPFYRFRWQSFPVVFTGDHVAIVVVVVAVLVGLVAFLKFTSAGIAIRGAAENDDRANELGINTRTLSTVVWTIAGTLSALAAVLLIPLDGVNVVGIRGASGISAFSGLPVALVAAVIGGMDDLPLTVAAAIGIAMFERVVFFTTSSTALVNPALLGLAIVALLIRADKLGRVDEAAGSTWAASEEVRPIPAVLARLPSVRAGVRRFVVALVIAVAAFPFVMSPSQVNLGSFALIDGIVVISLVILTGWGGQISLGQYAFVAAGALVGGALTAEAAIPFPVALLAGALVGAAAAVILGLTALRIRGLYLAVTTLLFALSVPDLFLNHTYFGGVIPDRVHRPSLWFIHFEDEKSFYFLCLALLGVCWWAALGLRNTRTGRTLIAARDNERGVQAFGVNLVRTRLVTFTLSGFMAAGAGALFAAHQHTVSSEAFGADVSVQVLLTAIIGGLGSIQGALLGAVYFAIVNFSIHGSVGRLFASSIGVLVVLLVFPGGLGSLAYSLRDAILRRVAIRRRIYVPSLLADHATSLDTRAPLAPRQVSTGVSRDVPPRYRQPSRIRVAGTSQRARAWSYE